MWMKILNLNFGIRPTKRVVLDSNVLNASAADAYVYGRCVYQYTYVGRVIFVRNENEFKTIRRVMPFAYEREPGVWLANWTPWCRPRVRTVPGSGRVCTVRGRITFFETSYSFIVVNEN